MSSEKMVLVPVEPTQAMLDSGYLGIKHSMDARSVWVRMVRAALAASPASTPAEQHVMDTVIAGRGVYTAGLKARAEDAGLAELAKDLKDARRCVELSRRKGALMFLDRIASRLAALTEGDKP